MESCCAADSRLSANVKSRLLELGEHSLSQLFRRSLGSKKSRLGEDGKLRRIRIRFMMHSAELWVFFSTQQCALYPELKAVPSSFYYPQNASSIGYSLSFRSLHTSFFRYCRDSLHKIRRLVRLYHNIELGCDTASGARRQSQQSKKNDDEYFHYWHPGKCDFAYSAACLSTLLNTSGPTVLLMESTTNGVCRFRRAAAEHHLPALTVGTVRE